MELAKYVLHTLKEDENFDMNSIVKEFDNDEKFVKSIFEFLKEIKWISEDENGKYNITLEGHRNCLDN